MISWKRKVGDRIGRALGLHIVRRGEAAQLFELDILERFLADFEIDCIFDVGANRGQYIERVRRCGYRGPVVSFEPIPTLANRLRIMSERDPNLHIEQIALDDRVRSLTFNVMVENQCSSIFEPDHSETKLLISGNSIKESIDLVTARLETFFDSYKEKLGFSRPFLKMDTQGNDIAVAKGGGQRLAEFAGLQSELSFVSIYRNQLGYREALDFYTAQGFEVTALVPNNAGFFPRLLELDCIMFNSRFHMRGRA